MPSDFIGVFTFFWGFLCGCCSVKHTEKQHVSAEDKKENRTNTDREQQGVFTGALFGRLGRLGGIFFILPLLRLVVDA